MLTSTEFGLVTVVLLLGAILWALWVLIGETRASRHRLAAIERHQLNPRTRITRAVMDNGPPTVEKDMWKAGQIARGKRTVVGGEPDSDLYQSLARGVALEENDDE